jgi:hypothetical protein
MRPGLVAVGAAFAIVGAGVIASVLWTADAPTVERNGSVAANNIAPGNWTEFTLPATSSSSASLQLHWSATGSVDVSWILTFSCVSPLGWCPEPTPAANWSSVRGGNWTHTGTAVALYVLYVQDATNVPINFTGTFVEKYRPAPLALSPLPLAVVITGGSLLLGTGAVAVYLGIFLPSGIYSPIDGISDELLYGGLDDEPLEPPPADERP